MGQMSQAPEAMQHAAELKKLVALYRKRKPRKVLEVGAYTGGTLYHWLQAKPELVAVVDDFNMLSGTPPTHIWQQWVRPGTRLEVIEGRSSHPATLSAVQALAPFDWVFIDADHGYEAVRADWERYRPLCTGVIAFHDILPPSLDYPEIEVSRLWSEIKAGGYRTAELIDNPAAPWGGIGIVFLNDERTKDAQV